MPTPTSSATTTTCLENGFIVLASETNWFRTASPSLPVNPPQQPVTSNASGRSALALLTAQEYHARHSASPCDQPIGVQADFESGMTAQPARCARLKTAGIHISACESPNTTIVRRLPAVPRRQI